MISERVATTIIRENLKEGKSYLDLFQIPVLKELISASEEKFKEIYQKAMEESGLSPLELNERKIEEKKRKKESYGKDFHVRVKGADLERLNSYKNRSGFIRQAVIEKLNSDQSKKDDTNPPKTS